MRDLRGDLGNVWRAASRLTSKSGGGRTVMFVSARDGEGTSSVAASIALLAAHRAQKAVWLVDLDLRRNAAFKGFEHGFAKRVGSPGRAFDASLRQEQIYSIVPRLATRGGDRLLTAHEIRDTQLFVTRFRNEYLNKGQRVQIKTQPGWWTALCQIADWGIVDAPSLERSPAALAIASQMDGVFLVVEADSTSADDVVAARREIEAHGGDVRGIIMNRVGSDARLADRFAS
ncbi:hypothetical protein RYZ27_13305 [Hyphomonas sp. FCG-A18]|uniref:hypothetical protein n=1 Tax=Hyphomonas sp. FCG-A18 TaxID=3080019 RepID=UPI002B2EF40B|nr:hypothetical protein RYZ27_13305 [Hyphomonas sp. FCG-A18]